MDRSVVGRGVGVNVLKKFAYPQHVKQMTFYYIYFMNLRSSADD